MTDPTGPPPGPTNPSPPPGPKVPGLRPFQVRYFLRQVDDSAGPDACWPWRGRPINSGYGVFGGAHTPAHRVAYELAIGPIPDGLVVDHLCDNRICVNPAHLQAVTQRVNILRSPKTMPNINAAKTHCPQGHPYSPENTYRGVNAKGGGPKRECRTCRRVWHVRSAA